MDFLVFLLTFGAILGCIAITVITAVAILVLIGLMKAIATYRKTKKRAGL